MCEKFINKETKKLVILRGINVGKIHISTQPNINISYNKNAIVLFINAIDKKLCREELEKLNEYLYNINIIKTWSRKDL